jgi:hypothetical protein
MAIQKKSLIKTLKTTKKANVAASAPATNEGAVTRKAIHNKSALRTARLFRSEG